jgi:hypothetical protein
MDEAANWQVGPIAFRLELLERARSKPVGKIMTMMRIVMQCFEIG